MKKTCPTCKNEYDDGGESWKTQCYECYQEYRKVPRIQNLRTALSRHDELFLTHPSVTKEELDKWIKEKGSPGWGAEEIMLIETPKPHYKKYKVWIDYTNFD